MPKGVSKYDGAFKKQIVEEMREKGLSYREIARQYEIRGAHSVAEMLEDKGVRQSMSRKGNCLDNAVMENSFGLLKTELLYLQDFDSLEHFKAELIDYLYYYNNRRIKLKLKGLTPAQHRYQTLQVAYLHIFSNFWGALQNRCAAFWRFYSALPPGSVAAVPCASAAHAAEASRGAWTFLTSALQPSPPARPCGTD